jgi:putative ABC transport system substrate-binding protein
LLSEIAPGLKRLAIMSNPDTAAPVSTFMPSFETAARSLKVEPIIASVHSDVEIETAIIALGREPGSGLVVQGEPFNTAHRAPIIVNLKTAKTLGLTVPLTLQAIADEVIE